MFFNKYLSQKFLEEINSDELHADVYEELKNIVIAKIRTSGIYDKKPYISKHYNEICETTIAATFIIYKFNNFNKNIVNRAYNINEIYEINNKKIGFDGETSISGNAGASIVINFAHDTIKDKTIQGSEYFLFKTMLHEICHVGSMFGITTGFDNINKDLNEILTVCIEDKLAREFCEIGVNCENIYSRPQILGKFDFGRDSLSGYPCKSIYGRFIMALEDEDTLIKNYFRLEDQDKATKYGQYLLQEYAPLIHVLESKPYNMKNEKIMSEYITNANNALFEVLRNKIDKGMSLDEYLNMTSKLSNLHIENIETGENVLQESLKMLDVYYFYKDKSNEKNIQKLFYGYNSDEFDNFESIICSLRMNYFSKSTIEKNDIQTTIKNIIPKINNLDPINDKVLSIEDLNNPKISFNKRRENLIMLNENNSSSIFRNLNTNTEQKINSMSKETIFSRLKLISKYPKFSLKNKLDVDTKMFFYNTLYNFDKKEQFESLLIDLNKISPKYLKSLLNIEKGRNFSEILFEGQKYEELQILTNIIDFKDVPLIKNFNVNLYLDDFLKKSWEIELSEKSLLSLVDLSNEIEKIPKDNLIKICLNNINTIECINDKELKNIYLEKFKDDLAHLINIKGLEDFINFKLNNKSIRDILNEKFEVNDVNKILSDVEFKIINIKNNYIEKAIESKDIFMLSNIEQKGDLNDINNKIQLKEIFKIFLESNANCASLLKIEPINKEFYSTTMMEVLNETKCYKNCLDKVNPNIFKDNNLLEIVKNSLNKIEDYRLEGFLKKRDYSEDLAINTLSTLLESNKDIAKNLFKNFSDELKENILERIDNLEDTKENSKLKEFKEERDKSSSITF